MWCAFNRRNRNGRGPGEYHLHHIDLSTPSVGWVDFMPSVVDGCCHPSCFTASCKPQARCLLWICCEVTRRGQVVQCA